MAPRTQLGRREKHMRQIQRIAIPERLIGHLTAKFPKPNVSDRLRQSVVFEHSRDVKVFEDDRLWTVRRRLGFRRDPSRRLVQRVLSYARYSIMDACEVLLRFRAVLTSLRLLAVAALRPFELLQSACKGLGIGMPLAIRANRHFLDPQVNSQRVAGGGWGIRYDFLDLDRDEPMSCSLTDHRFEIVSWPGDHTSLLPAFLQGLRIGSVQVGVLGQIAVLEETHLADDGKLYPVRSHMDGPRQRKGPNALGLLLELMPLDFFLN